MNYDCVLGVGFDPLEGLLRDLVDKVEGWTVMIRPMVVSAPASEVLLLVIQSSLRCVDNPIFVFVLLRQKAHHSVNRVPVHRFEPLRRVAHRDDLRRDVSQVQIGFVLSKPAPIPRH